MRDVRLPDYPLTLPVEVWFRDLDAMGHVNGGVYFSYFEQARTRYWLTLTGHPGGALADLTKIPIVVVHAECDYASPAVLGEPLLVGCRIAEVRKTSFLFEYKVVTADTDKSDAEVRVVATGKTVQVLYSWAEKKAVPVPEELLRKIEAREGAGVRFKAG